MTSMHVVAPPAADEPTKERTMTGGDDDIYMTGDTSTKDRSMTSEEPVRGRAMTGDEF
jgi:hypothetical protein